MAWNDASASRICSDGWGRRVVRAGGAEKLPITAMSGLKIFEEPEPPEPAGTASCATRRRRLAGGPAAAIDRRQPRLERRQPRLEVLAQLCDLVAQRLGGGIVDPRRRLRVGCS